MGFHKYQICLCSLQQKLISTNLWKRELPLLMYLFSSKTEEIGKVFVHFVAGFASLFSTRLINLSSESCKSFCKQKIISVNEHKANLSSDQRRVQLATDGFFYIHGIEMSIIPNISDHWLVVWGEDDKAAVTIQLTGQYGTSSSNSFFLPYPLQNVNNFSSSAFSELHMT